MKTCHLLRKCLLMGCNSSGKDLLSYSAVSNFGLLSLIRSWQCHSDHGICLGELDVYVAGQGQAKHKLEMHAAQVPPWSWLQLHENDLVSCSTANDLHCF